MVAGRDFIDGADLVFAPFGGAVDVAGVTQNVRLFDYAATVKLLA